MATHVCQHGEQMVHPTTARKYGTQGLHKPRALQPIPPRVEACHGRVRHKEVGICNHGASPQTAVSRVVGNPDTIIKLSTTAGLNEEQLGLVMESGTSIAKEGLENTAHRKLAVRAIEDTIIAVRQDAADEAIIL